MGEFKMPQVPFAFEFECYSAEWQFGHCKSPNYHSSCLGKVGQMAK